MRSKADPSRDHDRFGKYLELVPNSRIVFEWCGPECGTDREMPNTTVAISLTPRDGGTLVRLVHSGWPQTSEGQNARGPHVDGWNFYMDNLASFLTGGPDRREEAFGQLVRR